MNDLASEAIDYDPYAMPADAIREPPKSLWSALKMIGPGIILAGTIVGSGELLLTTSLGAQQGYQFLWLILFSCVIKVFVQIELGRYAISSGLPTLRALNGLPGPRLGAHVLVWWWLVMMCFTAFQWGAMTGTVGQSLNLAFPSVTQNLLASGAGGWETLVAEIRQRPEIPWAFLTCGVTLVLLWTGDYRRIEKVTTLLVVGVTLLTVTAASSLFATPFPIVWPAAIAGLGIHPQEMDKKAIIAAFGVFGITGVGASELFQYPYWCLEKGYARYVGRADGSADWERRARGWIRVMYLDAWASMVVFTISTVAFYFMGAAVLHPQHLDPKGRDMIETLSRMFVDTFGDWTRVVFLFGAGAVLFKTLYLSCAANARMLADFLSLSGAVRYRRAEQRAGWIHWLSLLLPVVALSLFLFWKEPKMMTTVGAVAQASTLPMISIFSLYVRYRRTNSLLSPSKIWDVTLWVAVVSISIVAGYAVYSNALGILQAMK